MTAVVMVWTGIALGAVGLLGLLRPVRWLAIPTRRRAFAVGALGAAVAVGGALLPAPERRAAGALTRLDEVVPVWQFDERHEVRIRATPAEVERAVRAVTAGDMPLFRVLTWMRHPRLPGSKVRESILAAPVDQPILDVALRSGFLMLAEEPGRELVFGALVLAPDRLRHLPREELERLRASFDAEKLRTLAEPGYAKAVMSFRWEPSAPGWTRLATETRVFATDAAARRRFAVYWRLIYPGSSLIRRAWLAAIRQRAEAGR
jgi:hypothetical protein